MAPKDEKKTIVSRDRRQRQVEPLRQRHSNVCKFRLARILISIECIRRQVNHTDDSYAVALTSNKRLLLWPIVVRSGTTNI